jgi:hypothetical protein
MNIPGHSSAHRPQPTGINPFARALAETRGAAGDQDPTQAAQAFDSLSSHGDFANTQNEFFDPEQQQQELLRQQKNEQLRQELHRKVNPVDQRDIYNAKEQQVKQEVDSIRQELKMFGQEVFEFKKEVEVTLMTTVSAPGQEGKYYLTFFKKLREFIALLRQKVSSARTWATTVSGKKSKQAGLNFKAKGHAQTKNVWDTMHHERQLARAGG